MHYTVQYCIVHYTVQYSTVQCTIQYSNVQCTIQYSTVQCTYSTEQCTIQYSNVQCTIQYSTVQCTTVYCSSLDIVQKSTLVIQYCLVIIALLELYYSKKVNRVQFFAVLYWTQLNCTMHRYSTILYIYCSKASYYQFMTFTAC